MICYLVFFVSFLGITTRNDMFLDLQTSINFWLFRICFWQIERSLPSRAEIYQTSTSWVFTDFHWFKETGRTTSAISRNRAQFPANERTFEKWMFSFLAVPREEIGKTCRFGFLEQKFARAEMSVLLKLQVICLWFFFWGLPSTFGQTKVARWCFFWFRGLVYPPDVLKRGWLENRVYTWENHRLYMSFFHDCPLPCLIARR